MSVRAICGVVIAMMSPAMLVAQHGGGAAPAPPVHTAPREATQFDFLIGQWELLVRPQATSLAARIHGAPRLLGTWKAWRGFDGWGVEDELRITDGSGNPLSLNQAMRVFDATAKQWTQSSLDVYRGRFSSSTGQWRDGEMHLTAKGTDTEGHPYVSRTRYYDITANSFKMQQDRSLDDGHTWTEGVLKIEAKRVAATAPR